MPIYHDFYAMPTPSSTFPRHGHYAPKLFQSTQPCIRKNVPGPSITELPTSLSPAPRTVTSGEQLRDDEMFAHKLQQLDLVDANQKLSDAESHQLHRPTSKVQFNLSSQRSAPVMQQRSTQSLQPDAQSPISNASSCRPESNTSTSTLATSSLLPEVVEPSRSLLLENLYSFENLPIPLIQDRMLAKPLYIPSNSEDLTACLEQHLQVPYPPQWSLPAITSVLYAYQGNRVTQDWLEPPESCSWRTVRPRNHVCNPTPPSYTFRFKTTGGSFRSPKFSWNMTCPDKPMDATKKTSKAQPSPWGYELKMDTNTRIRKSEILSHGKAKAILTTYVHALNYDSLRFIGPDGRSYVWVSSSKVSSVDGVRYDTIRHALFVAGTFPDPLFGEIVADHTYWDGFVDHNEVHPGVQCDGCQSEPINGLRWTCRICARHDVCEPCRALASSGQFVASILPTCDFSIVNLPDEALYIRSQTVDLDLVVATLQIMKDWEKDTLRHEKKSNIKGFLASEEAARTCDLGVMSYWKATDSEKKNAERPKHGTRVKAHAMVRSLEQTIAALGKIGDAAFSIAGLAAAGK